MDVSVKLSIKADKKNEYNCFHNSIYTIARNWNKECILMFIDMWDFVFDMDIKGTVGDRIRPYTNPDVYQYLSYHGISLQKKYIDNYDSFLSEVDKENSHKKNYIVSLDAYYCPWYFGFNKNHREHMCIIQEISDKIYLLDTFYTFGTEELSYEDLKKSIKYYFVVEKKESVEEINYLNLIKKSLEKKINRNNSMFDSFENFIKEFETSFDIQKEVQGFDNIENVTIFFDLKIIGSCRASYANCLRYISEKTNVDFDIYIEKLNSITQKWDKLKLLMIKSVFKQSSRKNKKLTEFISDIYMCEKALSEQLYIYVKSLLDD